MAALSTTGVLGSGLAGLMVLALVFGGAPLRAGTLAPGHVTAALVEGPAGRMVAAVVAAACDLLLLRSPAEHAPQAGMDAPRRLPASSPRPDQDAPTGRGTPLIVTNLDLPPPHA
ncbi:MAG: hypothetical protein KF817_03750 [Phycisphaeraceae bacterium]|nr:hypothetical protein [Phycisphaeraceae bacterium]